MGLRGRQAKASLAPTVRFLIVTVGGVQVALHADRVQGLLTTAEAALSGSILTAQAQTYAAIDLAGRLGLEPLPDGPETRTVLFARGSQRGYLRVDQVHGLQELEPSQVLPLSRHFQSEEQRWYQGLILFGNGVALILNPVWLVEGSLMSGGNQTGSAVAGQALVPAPSASDGRW